MFDLTMTSYCEQALENWEIVIFLCKIEAIINFYVKNRKNMGFSWDCLLNMLENDDSNLETNFWVHIASNIFKIIQFQNHGITPTPYLPTLKSYPTPRGKW